MLHRPIQAAYDAHSNYTSHAFQKLKKEREREKKEDMAELFFMSNLLYIVYTHTFVEFYFIGEMFVMFVYEEKMCSVEVWGG
jgi:hypothetical protein